MQQPVTISALYCYPIKGLGALDLAECELTDQGLAWDRRWMLVDERRRFITQRQLPAMAAMKVRLERHQLVVMAADGRYLAVPLRAPQGDPVATQVHGHDCYGMDEGDEAAEFFTRQFAPYLKGQVRLLRFAQDAQSRKAFERRVEIEQPRSEDKPEVVAHTGFADGFPLLVTSSTSLALVNQGLAERGVAAAEMARFRPNIVLDGLAPFAEHDIETLELPHTGVRLWLCKPCVRCPVTRVDQTDGHVTHPHEPLPLLKTLGPYPGTAIFGVNAVVLAGSGRSLVRGEQGQCS